MHYCPYCGNAIAPNAAVCLHCGQSVMRHATGSDDTGSFGWAVLGFFVPVAGLILWLLWKDSAPRNAKKAGLGALLSTIVSVVFTVLFYILYFGLMMFTFIGS